MNVKIYKDGNAIRIGPVKGRTRELIKHKLTYTRLRHLVTREEKLRANNHIEYTEVECYATRRYKNGLHIVTNAGYLTRVQEALAEENIGTVVKDLRPHPKPKVYTPRWSQLDGVDFRYKQKSTLQAMTRTDNGRVWWATGTGKSFLVPHFCMLMPKAKILVTTKHLPVLETLWHRLRARLPSVGIYHSKKKQEGRRVMCVSSGSLHHFIDWMPDYVIADEVHELATDKMFEVFARFRQSRMIGLSANHEDRFDGADFELEGVFGPVIAELSYDEAQKKKMVVPIHVHWRNVYGDDVCCNMEGVPQWRHGIWRNKARNRQIAKDANAFPDDQVLITVQTLEHACYLKKFLPDFHLCYSPSELHQDKLDRFKKNRLIPLNEKNMTRGRLQRMRRKFEKGTLKKVIATSVWNRGVDFKNLQVLIRADASSSAINDTQIPGRLSRTAKNKTCGILIDYLDQFNESFERRAKKRKGDYKKKKWKQILPKPDSDAENLRREVLLGD